MTHTKRWIWQNPIFGIISWRGMEAANNPIWVCWWRAFAKLQNEGQFWVEEGRRRPAAAMLKNTWVAFAMNFVSRSWWTLDYILKCRILAPPTSNLVRFCIANHSRKTSSMLEWIFAFLKPTQFWQSAFKMIRALQNRKSLFTFEFPARKPRGFVIATNENIFISLAENVSHMQHFTMTHVSAECAVYY